MVTNTNTNFILDKLNSVPMKEQKGFGSLSSVLTASYCLFYFVEKMLRTIQYPTFFPLHLLLPFFSFLFLSLFSSLL